MDPTGSFNINYTLLDGRIFAGDNADSSIVSGGYIVAPVAPQIPEPTLILLLGAAVLGACHLTRKRRQHRLIIGR